MVPMFESDLEDNVFRRRLMKEVAAGIPVHFSFYSPSVKVQVQSSAEHLSGANGRYIGDAVTIEFVPEDAAAVERVREFVWRWEEHNAFTAVRKINHLRRGVCPESVQGMLERVRGVDRSTGRTRGRRSGGSSCPCSGRPRSSCSSRASSAASRCSTPS